jgi:CRP/FNR family transcriptional regulator, cyclic AMP receptor protein
VTTHLEHRRDQTWGPDDTTQRSVRLLEAVPQLAHDLGPEQARLAQRALVVPVIPVARGAWERADLTSQPHHPFGAAVVSGLLTRHVDIGGYPGIDLYGPGDLVPVQELRRGTLPCGDAWSAPAHTELAVFDDRLLVAARRWPRLVSGLFALMQEQYDRLLLQLVIAEQPRVEDRLLLLFWQLADRFGKVTADGIVIRLALTHEALGRLIGARRPTVTLALRMLAERQALVRRPDRSWLVMEMPEDVAVTATGLTDRAEPRPIDVGD